MSTITHKIRNKRYRTKNNTLVLNLLPATSKRYSLVVCNLSIMGIGVNGRYSGEIDLEPGSIIEHAIISSTDDAINIELGRLVTHFSDADASYIGFSLIDTKLPIDGQLSKYLEYENTPTILPYDTELDPYHFDVGTFAKLDDDNRDLFSRCNQFNTFFKEWKKTPLYLYNTVRTSSTGTRVDLSLKRRGQGRSDFINMCSNDYLNMASHPKVLAAANKALKEYGFGPTGSPLVSGLTQYHEELSYYLAKQFGKEKVMLFPSGYAANVGSFTCLAGDKDLLLADFFAHASIQDGLKLCRATTRLFRHNDMDHLEKLLKRYRDDHAGCMIISEGIFSMGGDTCALDEIIDLAKYYQARVYIDEAHSYGLLGKQRLGITDQYGLIDRTDIIMGAFSKICGGHGGFIAADEQVIDWISWYGRSFMFSAAFPPISAAAVLTAIKIVFEEEPERLFLLEKNISHFIQGLRELGYKAYDSSHQSAIIPVLIGNENILSSMVQHLVENGVFVVPMIYPAVPRNGSLLRFTISSNHSISDLDYVLHVLESAAKTANFSFNDRTVQ